MPTMFDSVPNGVSSYERISSENPNYCLVNNVNANRPRLPRTASFPDRSEPQPITDPSSAAIGSEVELRWSEDGRVVEVVMAPCERGCMTPGLVRDLNSAFDMFDQSNVRIVLICSNSEQIFSRGGDLAYFASLIQSRNRVRLREYGIACIDLVYWALTGGRRNVTTVAVVSGQALGGGFEAALACDTIVAESGASFAFPEVLFGLFPGMGGYPMLASVIGQRHAEEACLSGKRYSAYELYRLGIVQTVVPAAALSKTVDNFVQRRLNAPRCMLAIREMKAEHPRVAYEQLHKNVELWVDAVMTLEDRDLRKIQRLIRRQFVPSVR